VRSARLDPDRLSQSHATDARTTGAFKRDILETDILVLGAGLAGMRAATAARQADPNLRVTLVSPRARASGSSFANRNNALGMQVPAPAQPDPSEQKNDFVAEALRLAAPGLAVPSLVQALAADASACLDHLLALGLNFRREPSGSLRLFPGCFSTVPRAVVFDGLAGAHAAFLAQARSLGVEMLHGFEALEFMQAEPGGRVLGARLSALRGGQHLDVRARSVIAALGGPAPLFSRRICGPGGSGLAYGLLEAARARLVNTAYLQWFWVEAKSLTFVNPGELIWPEHLTPLARARLQHCPVAYGLPDASLDQDLISRQGPQGIARAEHRERGWLDLVLAAQAGNGGALIDSQGRTSVAGLFACGECAGGMHGANRLGGAMVLSALVFGARAGKAAAEEASGLEARRGALLDRRAGPGSVATKDHEAPKGTPKGHEAPKGMGWLRRNMQRFGLPGADLASPARRAFVARLKELSEDSGAGQRERLLACSALALLEPQTGQP